MSHLRKPANSDLTGYDADRNLQVLSLNKTAKFLLIAGDGLDVFVDDGDCVKLAAGEADDKSAHSKSLTGWENNQVIRKISVVGKRVGTTQLHAQLDGRDWIKPLTISVVMDPSARQCGGKGGLGDVTPEIRRELQQLSLREAVLRVAEDQMHSAVATQSTGFGVYDIDPSYNWCGAFAYWCWAQAAAIKNVANPFGPHGHVLWSPQRAIHYGMDAATPVQLLRYAGGDPMSGKGKQEYREIGWDGNDLEPGDIVLLRNADGGWQHVSLVHDGIDAATIHSIDGNQGANQSIKIVKRSLTEKVKGGLPKLCFVHALV